MCVGPVLIVGMIGISMFSLWQIVANDGNVIAYLSLPTMYVLFLFWIYKRWEERKNGIVQSSKIDYDVDAEVIGETDSEESFAERRRFMILLFLWYQLWKHRRLFLKLAIVCWAITLILKIILAILQYYY